jgi:hypothetical protein
MMTALPAVTVSAIFLLWNACRREQLRRQRLLCQRVAYMLWVVAHGGALRPDDDESSANDLDRRLTTYTFLDRR